MNIIKTVLLDVETIQKKNSPLSQSAIEQIIKLVKIAFQHIILYNLYTCSLDDTQLHWTLQKLLAIQTSKGRNEREKERHD